MFHIDNVLIFKKTAVLVGAKKGDLTAEMTVSVAGKK